MIQYSSINDAWGNKETYKKNALNNLEGFNSKPLEKFVSEKTQQESNNIAPIEKPSIIPNIIPNITPNNIINKEHFEPILINSKCSFAEHLKICEDCRNSLTEHYENNNNAQINIFGFKINITKDVLKVIFILLIVLIFIIILSTINISLNYPKTNMKYYMVPHVSNDLQYRYHTI
jgi:hypothetical protein